MISLVAYMIAAVVGLAVLGALAQAASKRPLAGFLALEAGFVVIQFLLESVLADEPLATIAKEVLTAAFLLPTLILSLATPDQHRLQIRGFVLVALGAMGCAVGAAVLASDATRAVAALRFFAFYPALMFAAIAMRHQLANEPASLSRFFRWFLLLGVVVSTFGLLSYQFGAAVDPRWETAAENMKDVTQRSGIAVNAVVSTLGNRSNMGAFAVLILLMAAATRHVSFRKHWHLTAAASAVVGLALALTFSRTAYVGLAVGGLALFVAEKRPNIKILITVIVLGAAIIPLVDAVSPGSLEAALGSMGDSTISGRSAVWNEVASNLTDHPFGVGLGVYGNALRGFGQDARSGGLGAVDNSFLLIAVEQGLQSAAFWVVLFLAIGVRAFLNLRTARSMLGVAMARMVWAWYWAFIAMSITIDWFHALPVICPLWFFFGLQFALPALERTWESNALAYQSYAAARQARSLADRVKRSLGLCPLETARSGYGRVDVP